MTISQRQYRSPLPHLQLMLTRLQREHVAGTRKTSSFPDLCDMTFIPYDLRKQLLQTLVEEGYVIDEGMGQIRLTPLGRQRAV